MSEEKKHISTFEDFDILRGMKCSFQSLNIVRIGRKVCDFPELTRIDADMSISDDCSSIDYPDFNIKSSEKAFFMVNLLFGIAVIKILTINGA